VRVQRLTILFLCSLTTLFFAPIPTHADSWFPAKTEDYFSSDNVYLFRVVPRKLNSSLDYFRDKVEGLENAGQRPGGQPYCMGTLSKSDAGDSYQPVWTKVLINDVAPTRAIVSRSGEYVVTFDNWYAVGYGKDVVVIYGRDGKSIRELGLADLMPEGEIEKLPRSVSSIWWGKDHYIDETGKLLVLKIVANGKRPYGPDVVFRQVRVELATGKIISDGPSSK
jgi:hypothetical protein